LHPAVDISLIRTSFGIFSIENSRSNTTVPPFAAGAADQIQCSFDGAVLTGSSSAACAAMVGLKAMIVARIVVWMFMGCEMPGGDPYSPFRRLESIFVRARRSLNLRPCLQA
jgi:hypothetical protein